MKKLLATFAVALAVVCLDSSAFAQTGNGAPSGTHYNLNLLGKDKCSGDDLDGGNAHRIQVKLYYTKASDTTVTDKTNRIYLHQSFDGSFAVEDGNACDQDGAAFRLPAPGSYEIYVRELGKPGGDGQITTCGTDVDTQELVCSTDHVMLARSTGKSTFRNYTKELTTITYVDENGDTQTVDLFGDDFIDYFWAYDNNGLRLVQMRFYPLQ